jgi:hypothetical protein
MANKTFIVTAPDGKDVSVSAPENATDAQLIELAQKKYTPSEPKAEPQSTNQPNPEIISILNQELAKVRVKLSSSGLDEKQKNSLIEDEQSLLREIKRAGGQPTAGSTTPASEQDFRTQKAAGMGALLGGLGGSLVKGYDMLTQGARSGTPVEKWSGAMGYQNRGADTFAKAHEAEMGVRQGATIRNPSTGQVYKPQFTVAKPPVVSPSGLQLLSKSPIAAGAFGGAGALGGAQEAKTRYDAGDKVGSAIAGAGALGSAASMIPTIPTRVMGTGLAMASPAALAVLDRMRQVQAQPSPAPATPEEMQAAQQPAFRYARP